LNYLKAFSIFLLAGAAASAGTLTQIANFSTLAPNSTVSWGAAIDEGSSPASPYSRTAGGVGVTAVHTGDFLILVQGSAFFGNFNNGDVVLNSNFVDGPVTINFASLVQGAGLRIQRDELGPFTATLTAFGLGSVNFGSVSVTGTTGFSDPGDGTAPFLGVLSSALDIASIQLSVSHVGGVAGDTVDFTDLGVVVPEPSTVTLMLAAGALLAFRKTRR
jgi:hypothetical protein